MKTSDNPNLTGDLLLANFQSALTSLATIQYAKSEAAYSENALLEKLRAMGGNYLNPVGLAPQAQQDVTRHSLDAHIKKVQASQLEALSAAELQAMMHNVRQQYAGRKLQVNLLAKTNGAVESVWFDKRSGYRIGVVRRLSLTGTIEDVLLDQNCLVLKPLWHSRLFNNALQRYLVQPINPADLSPLVSFVLR